MAGRIKPYLFMTIILREQFFSQALFQTYFLLGLKIRYNRKYKYNINLINIYNIINII